MKTNRKHQLKLIKKAKLKVGDHVRVSRLKSFVQKGYERGWSYEIFIVSRVLKTRPPVIMYNIKDMNNEPIKGAFYEAELQKVVFDPNKPYPIEKILKKTGKKPNRKFLVQFLGWPDAFNQEIREKDIVAI